MPTLWVTVPLPDLNTPSRVIEDAMVDIEVQCYPPEPSVGYRGGLELSDIRSLSGRPIYRVWAAIEKHNPNALRQILEYANYELGP